MKKSENLIQKLFGSVGFGNSRIPLKSNVFSRGGSRGYSPIGQTGNSRIFDAHRQSPLLGNSSPSNRISGWLDRVAEFYEEDVDALAKNLGSVLEPIMLVLLGSVVGFLIVALYLPVFQATTSYQA